VGALGAGLSVTGGAAVVVVVVAASEGVPVPLAGVLGTGVGWAVVVVVVVEGSSVVSLVTCVTWLAGGGGGVALVVVVVVAVSVRGAVVAVGTIGTLTVVACGLCLA
jgi:hypothetical protein